MLIKYKEKTLETLNFHGIKYVDKINVIFLVKFIPKQEIQVEMIMLKEFQIQQMCESKTTKKILYLRSATLQGNYSEPMAGCFSLD